MPAYFTTTVANLSMYQVIFLLSKSAAMIYIQILWCYFRDTAGQERFRSITASYFKAAHVWGVVLSSAIRCCCIKCCIHYKSVKTQQKVSCKTCKKILQDSCTENVPFLASLAGFLEILQVKLTQNLQDSCNTCMFHARKMSIFLQVTCKILHNFFAGN